MNARSNKPSKRAVRAARLGLAGFDAEGGRWARAGAPSWGSCERHWLTVGGALTRHLGRLGPVTVRVTSERADRPWPDEARCLGLRAHSRVWVREIILELAGQACVVAHSVTPLPASHGTWQAMRRLRDRPLADLLYRDKTVQRSAFTVLRAPMRHPLGRLVAASVRAQPRPAARRLARRSVFARHGRPLLITECFLPQLFEIPHALPRHRDSPDLG